MNLSTWPTNLVSDSFKRGFHLNLQEVQVVSRAEEVSLRRLQVAITIGQVTTPSCVMLLVPISIFSSLLSYANLGYTKGLEDELDVIGNLFFFYPVTGTKQFVTSLCGRGRGKGVRACREGVRVKGGAWESNVSLRTFF